jgi:hypothetical protein
MGKLLRVVLGVLFCLVGLLQVAWCVVDSTRAIAARRWPTTIGTVDSSYVREVHGGRGGTGYMPAVTYTYQVDHTSYSGNRIWLTDFSAPRDEVIRTVDNFPVGSRVTVYFDYSDPRQSLLRPGLSWYSYAWLGLGCLALTVGVGLMLAGRLQTPAMPPNNRSRGP